MKFDIPIIKLKLYNEKNNELAFIYLISDTLIL
jgi:hypothetical protein